MDNFKTRDIKLIIVHCSASDNPEQDSPESVLDLHMGQKGEPVQWGKYKTEKRGWDRPGYAYFITKDGKIWQMAQESIPTWHCKGFNSSSIGVCLSGDFEFSEAQFKALERLVSELKERYKLNAIDIVEHRKLNPDKTCPNFTISEKIKIID